MKYKFRSVFDRQKEYTIESDEPLDLYNDFSVSITKIDSDLKTYSYDNIDCQLKYMKRGNLGVKYLELDKNNFSGFYMMVETFKQRKCLKMGEPIEIVLPKKEFEYQDTNLDNADAEVKIAFEKYLKENNIMENIFQCFLHGVSYGKKKA